MLATSIDVEWFADDEGNAFKRFVNAVRSRKQSDAPMTVELEDRYAIISSLLKSSAAHLRALGGRSVGERFRYCSDGNKEWLDVPQRDPWTLT